MIASDKIKFKTAILADSTMSQLLSNGNLSGLADACNADVVPTFYVWRTSVDVFEIMSNGMDWTRVDNLSIGKARIWEWMSRLGTLNPSKDNIRAGIDATWVGTSADLAVRDVVYAHCKRPASWVEKVLAIGTGSLVSPATMNYEGPISYTDFFDIF